MYKQNCKKCGSSSLHTEVKGNNTGLYCDNCGAWQQWLSQDDLRAFKQRLKRTQETPQDKLISKRLKEFVEFLDKEIDRKMTTMPLSNEDAISKSSYCVALERVKVSIYNILDGKDYNYVEE